MALPGAVVLAVTRAERDGESAAEALPLLLGDPAPEREKRALLVAQGEAAPLLDAAAGGEKVARSAVAVGGCVTVLIALGVPSPSLLGDAVEVGNKGVVLGFALSDGAPLCDAVALGLALPPPPGWCSHYVKRCQTPFVLRRWRRCHTQWAVQLLQLRAFASAKMHPWLKRHAPLQSQRRPQKQMPRLSL